MENAWCEVCVIVPRGVGFFFGGGGGKWLI